MLKKFKCKFALSYWLAAMMVFLDVAKSQAQSLLADSSATPHITLNQSYSSIWENGVGDGFRAGTRSWSLSTGAGYGFKIFGSKQNHDLALVSLAYGYMLGSVKGEGHWYRGNWEVRGEFFTGAQFSPSTDYVVGLAPHLRYNFATGTPWIAFVDAGAGISATSIGSPDLSHTFQFNVQAAAGLRWFCKDNLALSAEARYLHLSCASMYSPNLGLNTLAGFLGVSWFF